MSALKKCPRYYQYTIVEGWRPNTPNTHLFFGQLYHSNLEHFERRMMAGMNFYDSQRQMVSEAVEQSRGLVPLKTKSRESLIRSLVWYTERWKTDILKTVTLKESGAPAIELSFQYASDFRLGDISYTFCGHLDKVVTYEGMPLVLDRKTSGTTLGTYYFEGFSPNSQMSFYPFMAEKVYDIPVRGVLIDAVQVAITFSEYGRSVAYRTRGQLDEWWNDTQSLLRQSVTYATQQYWPINDEACRGCAFRPICSRDPSVRNAFLEANYTRHYWNPLEARQAGQEALSLDDN